MSRPVRGYEKSFYYILLAKELSFCFALNSAKQQCVYLCKFEGELQLRSYSYYNSLNNVFQVYVNYLLHWGDFPIFTHPNSFELV